MTTRIARLIATAFVVTLTLVGIQHTAPLETSSAPADPTAPFIVTNAIR